MSKPQIPPTHPGKRRENKDATLKLEHDDNREKRRDSKDATLKLEHGDNRGKRRESKDATLKLEHGDNRGKRRESKDATLKLEHGDNRGKRRESKDATLKLEHGDTHGMTPETKKISPYFTTLPIAVMKFSNLQKRKQIGTASGQKLTDPKYDGSLERPFGFGPLVFPVLQRFNNIKFFMGVYFVVVLAHGMIYALVDLSIERFHQLFSLSERELFLMNSSDYFASFLVALPVGYFGSRENRSKWVAASTILIIFASASFAVIYLKYEIIRPVEESEELCIDEDHRTTQSCEESKLPYKSTCIYLFTIGQVLHGVSSMPLFILAVTYIFDHIPIKSAGLYLAIADFPQVLGYTIGYAFGARTVEYLHNQTVKETGVTHNVQQWQTNWIAGFIIPAVLSCLTLFPLLCFPSNLPGVHKLRAAKDKAPPTFDKRLKNKEVGPHLKDFFHIIWNLLKNPLLMLLSLCKALESLIFKGVTEFVPKYLESQFLLMHSFATSLSGLILFPAFSIGHILGGLIVDKLEMSCKNKIKFVIAAATASVFLFVLIFFVECDPVKSAGINEDYDGTANTGNLTAPCNEHCTCPSSIHASICGRDETEYFSACFAGCKSTKYFHHEQTFYNCSCIKQGLTAADTDGDFIDAVFGKCNSKCYTLPLFLAFAFSSMVFQSLINVPVTLLILQCVPTSLNSMGLSLTFTIWRASGSFIIPILFEELINMSCIYWDINRCGIRGRCWIFEKKKLDYILVGICCLSQLCLALFSWLALLIYDCVVVETTEKTVTPVKKVNVIKEGKK